METFKSLEMRTEKKKIHDEDRRQEQSEWSQGCSRDELGQVE